MNVIAFVQCYVTVTAKSVAVRLELEWEGGGLDDLSRTRVGKCREGGFIDTFEGSKQQNGTKHLCRCVQERIVVPFPCW